MPIRPSAKDPVRRAPRDTSPLGAIQAQIKTDGVESVGLVELVALLIAPGSPEFPPLQAAAELCQRGERFDFWRTFRPRGIAKLTGIPETAAIRLLSALELGARVHRLAIEEQGSTLTPEGVFRWAQPKLTSLRHEEVWALCLDGGGRFTSSFQVSRGGVGAASLLPRDILGPVLREAAAGFLLVHNHPSGDPTPSREDREMTDALTRAAAVCGTPLVDHVVVGRYGYVSLMGL